MDFKFDITKEWVNKLPKEIRDGVTPTDNESGRGFVRKGPALLGLMGMGARLMGKMSGGVMWLVDNDCKPIEILVNENYSMRLTKEGMIEVEASDYPFTLRTLNKKGRAMAEKLFETVKEEKKAEKPKKENESPLNSHVVDHALGAYCDAYILQVVFDDFESAVKAMRAIGISNPKLEAVTPIIKENQNTKILDVIAETKVDISTLRKSTTHCSCCGVPFSHKGRRASHGFNFCKTPRCTEAKKRLKAELAKPSSAT